MQKLKLLKVKKWSRQLSPLFALAYTVYQFVKDDPQTALGVVRMTWPFVIVGACALFVWGYSDESENRVAYESWFAVGVGTLTLLLALIWTVKLSPATTVDAAGGQAKSNETTVASQAGIDTASVYWEGYIPEHEALKILGYYVAILRGFPESDVLIRGMLRDFVREDKIQVRWVKIGEAGWRYDLPTDSIEIIFEVEKYGPRRFGEPRYFRREYYTSSIMVLSRANWKDPDWKIPKFPK